MCVIDISSQRDFNVIKHKWTPMWNDPKGTIRKTEPSNMICKTHYIHTRTVRI